jgi:hypothetical protein
LLRKATLPPRKALPSAFVLCVGLRAEGLCGPRLLCGSGALCGSGSGALCGARPGALRPGGLRSGLCLDLRAEELLCPSLPPPCEELLCRELLPGALRSGQGLLRSGGLCGSRSGALRSGGLLRSGLRAEELLCPSLPPPSEELLRFRLRSGLLLVGLPELLWRRGSGRCSHGSSGSRSGAPGAEEDLIAGLLPRRSLQRPAAFAAVQSAKFPLAVACPVGRGKRMRKEIKPDLFEQARLFFCQRELIERFGEFSA